MNARRLFQLSVITTATMALVFIVLIASTLRGADTAVTDRSEQPAETLTIAVTRLVGGWAAWPSHTKVLAHVSETLDVPIRVKFLAPGESAEAVFSRHSEVDAAFMSTYAFLIAREGHGGIEHIATPIIRGRTTERAVFVVSARSPHTSLSDLRGARLALSPPGVGGSIPGNAYARWVLLEKGFGVAEDFFAEVDETYTQDANLRRVLDGSADATTVLLSQLASWPRGSFRVLESSRPFAMPPFAVSPRLEDAEAERLIDALMSYKPTSGSEILSGYIRPRQEDYSFQYMLLSRARDGTLSADGEER